MTTPITDIHAHILPGLDDGPIDIDDTSALIEAMRVEHIDRVFCTSHYHSPHFAVSLAEMDAAFSIIRQTRDANSKTPTLALGAEVRLSQSLTDDLEGNRIPQLGDTRYVLVEFDTPAISEHAMSLVYELCIRKFSPIMAHPERNLAVQKNPALVDTLRAAGLLMQATAMCFTANHQAATHQSNKLAWALLEQGKIDLIASDAHNTTTRPPGLQAAYESIATRLGDTVSEALMANANAVWENAECTPIEVAEKRASGGFRKWLRR